MIFSSFRFIKMAIQFLVIKLDEERFQFDWFIIIETLPYLISFKHALRIKDFTNFYLNYLWLEKQQQHYFIKIPQLVFIPLIKPNTIDCVLIFPTKIMLRIFC